MRRVGMVMHGITGRMGLNSAVAGFRAEGDGLLGRKRRVERCHLDVAPVEA